MRFCSSAQLVRTTAFLAFLSPAVVFAQNSIQLFSPLNVRGSQTSASATNPLIFNTTTVNLSCPASPVAYLSSAPSSAASSSSGNVLADNFIEVSNLTTGTGPISECAGGFVNPATGSVPSCFTRGFEGPVNQGALTGDNPDTLVASGGLPPVNISAQLISGTQQVKVDLVDTGGYVASSSLYLNTNCSSSGVNGPAQISGNTIPPANPTPIQLDQNFNFNSTPNQNVGFSYDLSGALNAGTLSINPNGVNPQVQDAGLDPLVGYPKLVSGTSFASSMCLVHNGELMNGQPVCKIFTLQCTTGNGDTATGAQCPSSTIANEVLQDNFDGPAFTLPDITLPGGPTFHEGMGFLMASEGWQGGPCTFDPASGLGRQLCPENLLVSFSGPGLFSGTGQTTHPNSLFISVAQVPEALTTVTPTDLEGNPLTLGPGNWTNNPHVALQFSTQPPYLTGTSLPGASSFVPAPIAALTYGVTPGATAPTPGTTTGSDTVLTNPVACPAPSSPNTPAAAVFTPPLQTLNPFADGNYLVHYEARDCAGTAELHFVQDPSTQAWSTNFYTYPVNVDTITPQVTSGPTLSPAGPYTTGQVVTATYACTDDRSGVVQCGSHTFASGQLSTGSLTEQVPTYATGPQSFTILAVDAAGNKMSQTISYQVNAGVDPQVKLTLATGTVTYPLGTNVKIQVAKINSHVPTGTVKLLEGSTVLATLTLDGTGTANYYLAGEAVGAHLLYAAYLGDANNVAGDSASSVFHVSAIPVTLNLSCSGTPLVYGSDFNCGIYASSNEGAPLGTVQYSLDGKPVVSLNLSNGTAALQFTRPAVGAHTIVVSYSGQMSFATASSKMDAFIVNPAPVYVALTPSAFYLTGGNLTLNASVQSWSAGPPNQAGTIAFSVGSTLLTSVPVTAQGTASLTVPVSSLPNGTDAITATYSNGANYGTGTATVTLQVAH